MVNKSTFLILTIVSYVASSALKDSVGQQLFLAKSYNYNHPPLFEANKDLEDKDAFEVRKIRQAKSMDQADKHYPISSNLESEIPVTVVYDSGLETSNLNRIKKRKLRRRLNSSQEKINATKIEENKVLNYEKESSTENPIITTPSPKTVVPKVFTKRPQQYNPVVKTVRQRQREEPEVKIVNSSNYVYSHNGNYHYSYEGTDGTVISSEGGLKSFDNDKTGESVVGSVHYKDRDGNDVNLTYTADENGYRPHGDHLPTPPPIPPAIARALKYLATKTTPEPVTEPTKID
ncbi:uncharacterized protein LOC123654627 [Melitaea cinxia]|uniref:uncharacterized protein LOC123654627 n=1 Tax=Melitaea cinxia TaxID=113334 RepID=UPI001E270454|nr:uncharacterized protein LOC123654627 [Melitaea cinxia]